MIHRPTLLGCLLLGLCTASLAQEERAGSEAITIQHEARALASTRVMLPPGFDSARAYPLVLAVHGFGSSAESFERVGAHFSKRGFIVALPQGMYAVQLGEGVGYDWFLHQPPTVRKFDELRLRALKLVAESQIPALLAEMNGRYKIEKTYMMGFSQGGIVAYLAALRNHTVLSGVAIFGSLLDPEWIAPEALEQASALPVLIVHGSEDELVPLFEAEATRDLLVRYGYAVAYATFKGGHQVPANQLSLVTDWIEAAKR